ncbi:hypothetical protein D1O30_03755 [Methylocystis hirsuta]|uniref:FAD-dependent oxidoreductase n=1 Tax=Methylocystis hirsuta TaxID=369798 RepID=A0A3M9XKP7_9HYPH|nr:hypothetical protein D1O30_03755 [Methylocystis hirsuta]
MRIELRQRSCEFFKKPRKLSAVKVRKDACAHSPCQARSRANAETCDAIVIGAGRNGLACACYLARAGLSAPQSRLELSGAASSRSVRTETSRRS